MHRPYHYYADLSIFGKFTDVVQDSSADNCDEVRTMLTPLRSFILQIDTETDLDAGRVHGRVEIIATGETQHFRSLADLLRILGLASERAL